MIVVRRFSTWIVPSDVGLCVSLYVGKKSQCCQPLIIITNFQFALVADGVTVTSLSASFLHKCGHGLFVANRLKPKITA